MRPHGPRWGYLYRAMHGRWGPGPLVCICRAVRRWRRQEARANERAPATRRVPQNERRPSFSRLASRRSRSY